MNQKIRVKCEEGIDLVLPDLPQAELDNGKDPMFWFMVSVICLQITVLIFIIVQV